MKASNRDWLLFIVCFAWAVLWVFIGVGDRGWLPRVDCLFDLATLAAFIPLLFCAIVFFVRALLQRRLPLGAGASLLVMVLALLIVPRLPAKPTEVCEIPGTDAVIRFYRVESRGGATTSDGYRVTFQDAATDERAIFHAYSSPGISAIECQKEAVVLLDYHRDPIIISLQWIKSDLIHRPLEFYKGILNDLEYQEEVRDWGDVMIPTPTPTK